MSLTRNLTHVFSSLYHCPAASRIAELTGQLQTLHDKLSHKDQEINRALAEIDAVKTACDHDVQASLLLSSCHVDTLQQDVEGLRNENQRLIALLESSQQEHTARLEKLQSEAEMKQQALLSEIHATKVQSSTHIKDLQEQMEELHRQLRDERRDWEDQRRDIDRQHRSLALTIQDREATIEKLQQAVQGYSASSHGRVASLEEEVKTLQRDLAAMVGEKRVLQEERIDADRRASRQLEDAARETQRLVDGLNEANTILETVRKEAIEASKRAAVAAEEATLVLTTRISSLAEEVLQLQAAVSSSTLECDRLKQALQAEEQERGKLEQLHAAALGSASASAVLQQQELVLQIERLQNGGEIARLTADLASHRQQLVALQSSAEEAAATAEEGSKGGSDLRLQQLTSQVELMHGQLANLEKELFDTKVP